MSVVADSDPDDPQPAPVQQKCLDTIGLVSKKYIFDFLSTKKLNLTKMLTLFTSKFFLL